MAMNEILNPFLNPLLNLSSFWALMIVSIIVALITTFIYKYTTNQTRLKELKKEIKSHQDKIKKSRDNPEKSLESQKEMMKVNMEYMKSSFKPMFFTLIPVLLFFGWIGANLAYDPINPDMDFNITVTLEDAITGNVSLILPENVVMEDVISKEAQTELIWTKIKGSSGEHDLKVVYSETGEEQYFKILISEKQEYLDPRHELKSEVFSKILVGNNKLRPFDGIYFFQNIPWVSGFGWLGAYILFSLIFSTSLRKLFKIA